MYGFLLDHLQGFVVILYCNMSSINIGMEFSKAKTYREDSLYIGVSGINVSKYFHSKGYGPIVLDESNTKAIFTGINL